MSSLSPRARRRSLMLRLHYIEDKIVSVQEELFRLKGYGDQESPSLFPSDGLGAKVLKSQLEHLEGVARTLREEISLNER